MIVIDIELIKNTLLYLNYCYCNHGTMQNIHKLQMKYPEIQTCFSTKAAIRSARIEA